MKRIAPALALLVALSGCASFSTIEISDRGIHPGEGERLFSKGQTLFAEFDPLGLGPDWTERVYVYSGSWNHGILSFFHKGALPQHTERWKVEVRPLNLRDQAHILVE